MFGMQQHANMQVHSKAMTKIYDVLIVAIKSAIPSATTPVRTRDARDGVALAGFIWNHLEELGMLGPWALIGRSLDALFGCFKVRWRTSSD